MLVRRTVVASSLGAALLFGSLPTWGAIAGATAVTVPGMPGGSGTGTKVLDTGLNDPYNVATSPNGTVYVADYGAGDVVAVAADGTKTTVPGDFPDPDGVAVDSKGNLYVADAVDGVYKITPSGTETRLLSGTNAPTGVAVDAAGDVYVSLFRLTQIQKITPQGTVTSFGSDIDEPYDLAVDPSGDVYVANYEDGNVLKITPSGSQSTVPGSYNAPAAVAYDNKTGDLIVADSGTGDVTSVTPSGATHVITTGTPTGVAVDASGAIYVADQTTNDLTYYGPAPSATASSGAATVTWTAPTSTGGSPITSYSVSETDVTTSKTVPGCHVAVSASSKTSCTVTGLTNGDSYTFTVSAANARGTGPSSATSSAVVPHAPVPTAPTAPQDVKAGPLYKGVSVTWTSPTSDGNSPITSYEVFSGTAPGAESSTSFVTVPASLHSVSLTGLAPWTTYYVTVKAVNGVGVSIASSEAHALSSDFELSTVLQLSPNQTLVSQNNLFDAILQSDGNLVIYNRKTSASLFQTQTNTKDPAVRLVLKSSGVLELLDAKGKVVWTPKASPGVATSLQLTNSGQLELLSATKAVLWTS